MAVAAGTSFDRYEILAPLGTGGTGEVQLALDPRLGRGEPDAINETHYGPVV